MWNRFFYAFCMAIFLHHLITTALFLLPVKSEYVTAYMLPFFYQRWKLFAPDPPRTSLYFLYRCKVKGDWVDWRDLSSNLQQEFSDNPFGGAGKLLLVQNSIGQKAVKSKNQVINSCRSQAQVDCLSESPYINRMVKKESAYKKANLSAYQFCKKEFGQSIEGIQIRVTHMKTRPFDKRAEASLIPEKTVTDFPPLSL